MSHTNFTEVTWMVFVEIDTMVMLATSVTATSRVLAVFTNTAMSMRHMTAKLPGLFLVCTHDYSNTNLQLKKPVNFRNCKIGITQIPRLAV